MSIAVVWEISCDAEGCEETITHNGGYLKDARTDAWNAGWSRTRAKYDLCLAHRVGHHRSRG